MLLVLKCSIKYTGYLYKHKLKWCTTCANIHKTIQLKVEQVMTSGILTEILTEKENADTHTPPNRSSCECMKEITEEISAIENMYNK